MSDRRIYIEINNTCNLKCPFCPYTYKKVEKSLNFPIEQLEKVLEDVKENVDYRIIYFHNLNEPLLYPQFRELINICDQKELKYGITTNGILLNKFYNEIADSNMKELNISYQVNSETMNRERGNPMTIEQYRNHILKYTNVIAKRFKGEIKIKLLLTNQESVFNGKRIYGIEKHSQLINEINKFYFYYHKKFLQPEEIDIIKKLPLDKFCKIQISNNIYIELFPFLTWGNTYKKIHKAYIGKCDGFSGQIQIKCNGNVLPCCYDVDSKLVVGNVFDERLSVIKEKKYYKNVEKNIYFL